MLRRDFTASMKAGVEAIILGGARDAARTGEKTLKTAGNVLGVRTEVKLERISVSRAKIRIKMEMARIRTQNAMGWLVWVQQVNASLVAEEALGHSSIIMICKLLLFRQAASELCIARVVSRICNNNN